MNKQSRTSILRKKGTQSQYGRYHMSTRPECRMCQLRAAAPNSSTGATGRGGGGEAGEALARRDAGDGHSGKPRVAARPEIDDGTARA